MKKWKTLPKWNAFLVLQLLKQLNAVTLHLGTDRDHELSLLYQIWNASLHFYWNHKAHLVGENEAIEI